MANREELGIIRQARAGEVQAQLALGKLYLFGGGSLPASPATALHWLQRAAQHDCAEAWMLIGLHITAETAQHDMPAVLLWYERAFDDGVRQAGLVLAQLVLPHTGEGAVAALRPKALRALHAAAQAGLPDAQWLLARHGMAETGAPPEAGGEWLLRAADSGVSEAQYAVLEQSWADARWDTYLQRALPLARALLQAGSGATLAPPQVLLMSRCALAMARGDAADPAEILSLRESAAQGGDRCAQLALGLWFARMDGGGARLKAGAGAGIASANFKRAIRWLTQAGEQGLAEAWFALSRVYARAEFSQRSVKQAQVHLERAADMGHAAAQLECGINAWRSRRDGFDHDLRAAFWLLKAAAQGSAEAETALSRIAPRPTAAATAWMRQIAPLLTREHAGSEPWLAARLELASLFQLSRAEALLLDVIAADHGHCLVIDIRAIYGRSKRRLVLLRTAQERQALDRIARLFDNVDCSPEGPEGNYRQRLYRLKTWLPGLAGG